MCGLRAEARALGALSGDQRLTVGISGARPDRATLLAREMAGSGVDMLVSWGIAGGLDPALPSGTLILPGAVAGPDGLRLGPEVRVQLHEARRDARHRGSGE